MFGKSCINRGDAMKIVYFDVEEYELEYLQQNPIENASIILSCKPLNALFKISSEYLDADIISVFTTSRIDKQILQQFKNLKLIALRSVGFNHIDVKYCKEHNITVVNAPNYGNISVAEYALALLLDVCRKITFAYNDYKNLKVCPNTLIGTELFEKTIGIVGVGAIGSAFAKIAYGLGMKILGFDYKKNQKLIQKYKINYVDFETLLKQSDFISIHAPLTTENYHMFNEEAFKRMKKSAIIINTGRGELIDIQALYNALMNKEIAGAGLDVLENEENISDVDYMNGINRMTKLTLKQTLINSRLFQADNVIITPHTAYNTKEAIRRILLITQNNINNFICNNLEHLNIINN